jgi:hypothetical protein
MPRHVFASTLVSRGIDPRTVADYIGHTDDVALRDGLPVRRSRNDLVRAASPQEYPSRVHTINGIGRSIIHRILRSDGPEEACDGPGAP